jgi:hypothetical protein
MCSESIRQKLTDRRVVYGVMAAEFFTPGFCQIASNAGPSSSSSTWSMAASA